MSRLIAVLLVFLVAAPSFGQGRGPVTGFDLPRFVSLKAREANIRRGPAYGQRIDWVFTRRGMPLKVTAEYDVWRRVEDAEGEGGWIHSTLISGERSVLVMMAGELFARPLARARVNARIESGVVAALRGCTDAGWCEIEASALHGWMPKDALWGVD